jgi:general secretion pathway protein N
LLAATVTVLSLWPAGWLSGPLERVTARRLTLVDAQGTLWRGSAYVAGAPLGDGPVTPVLPGRMAWRLSPVVLLGRLDLHVENPSALADGLHVTGSWSRWQVSPGAALFPAVGLGRLGAPLNTLRPEGLVRLAWGPLELAHEADKVVANGTMSLDIEDLSSRLSPIKPLGAYRLTIRWVGLDVRVVLETIRGPMLLSGSGGLSEGRWRFTGRAEAAPGYEKDLANFLNLLGETRREGDKDVIALQFQ